MTTANSSPTQCQALLEYLRNSDNGITALEALQHLGIGRLAARVFELRREGYLIKDEVVAVGDGKHVSRYTLVDKSAKVWKCTRCGAVVVPSVDSVAPGYAFAWCGKCGKREIAREVVQ